MKTTVPNAGLSDRRVLFATCFCAIGAVFALGSVAGTQTANSAMSGSWSIVTPPNTSGKQNDLRAVTCNSASDCWSVGVGYFGYYDGSDVAQTLIEHFDGTSWSITSSPNMSSERENILSGLSCTSALECWSVGYYFNGSAIYQTLIEHYNGTTWSVVGSPNAISSDDNILKAVKCVSSSDCWAVGYYLGGTASTPIQQALIEHYDGTTWNVVDSPVPSSTSGVTNGLNAVSCTNSNDCWAVGWYRNDNDVDQTLIEHYDGAGWTIVSSPAASSRTDRLAGVTCALPTDCWAVGWSEDQSSPAITLHYDGGTWSVVSNPVRQGNVLSAVTCASTNDCWAVGANLNGSSEFTLVEHWDGDSWSTVPSPNFLRTYSTNALSTVTCTAGSDCWAVGISLSSSTFEALIERYSSRIPLVTVASTKSHGAGTFYVDLPITGNPGIESRSGGENGNYSIVFTFLDNLIGVGSADVTNGTGSITTSTIGPNQNQYTVNLTAVSNAQVIKVSLTNVNDVAGRTATILLSMGILLGDVNGSGRVDSGDVSLVRQQTLQPITSSNFREDINASGRIDSGDVSIVRQQTLTSLP